MNLIAFISGSRESGGRSDTSKSNDSARKDRSKQLSSKSASKEKGNQSSKSKNDSREIGMRSEENEMKNNLYDGVPKCLFNHRDAIINADGWVKLVIFL